MNRLKTNMPDFWSSGRSLYVVLNNPTLIAKNCLLLTTALRRRNLIKGI